MSKFNKIVHQIWFQGKENIPKKYYNNIKTNKNILQDWQYIIWDDFSIQKLLEKMGKKYLDKYNNYKYLHQKVDYGRYCILYIYGGFYVDIDAYIIKDPSYIINKFKGYEVYLSYLNLYLYENLITIGETSTINNGIILAYPKSELMFNLINKCPDKTLFTFSKYIEITMTTGPKIFSKFVNETKKVKIFNYDVFEPCIRHKCDITNNTIVVHKHENSWINPIINNIIYIYIENRKYVNFIFIIIILFFIIKRFQ